MALQIIASMLIKRTVGEREKYYPVALIMAASGEEARRYVEWIMRICFYGILSIEAIITVIFHNSRDAVFTMAFAIFATLVFAAFGWFMSANRTFHRTRFWEYEKSELADPKLRAKIIMTFAHAYELLIQLERIDSASIGRIHDEDSLRKELEVMFAAIAKKAEDDLKKNDLTQKELLGDLIDIAVVLGIFTNDYFPADEFTSPDVHRHLYTRAFSGVNSPWPTAGGASGAPPTAAVPA